MPRKKCPPKEESINRRVTVRDIAEEVGLHFTTVAEALRGSSRIKEATRKRVEDAAVRLGYRPDPILSALSAYRSSNVRNTFQGVLVWINGYPQKDKFTRDRFFVGEIFKGALERANNLGYKLDPFWIGEKGMTGKRASTILKARSILGIIVGPMPEITPTIDIDWEQFNSLRVGYSLADPRITNVISDQFGNTQWAYKKVVHDGFRRIGFACPRTIDNRVSNKFSGGFLSMDYIYEEIDHLPMYLDENIEGSRKEFLDWYNKYRPEVILAGGRSIYYRFLVEEGIRIPGDVQFVSLHCESLRMPIAGMSQNGQAVGGVAVDHIVDMIQHFKIGLESYPKTTTIPGRWVDNESYNPTLLKGPGKQAKKGGKPAKKPKAKASRMRP